MEVSFYFLYKIMKLLTYHTPFSIAKLSTLKDSRLCDLFTLPNISNGANLHAVSLDTQNIKGIQLQEGGTELH